MNIRPSKKWVLATGVLLTVLGAGALVLIPNITFVDYAFIAEGHVVDLKGKPVPDATVILKLDQTVYEPAITPVRTARTQTDKDGRFVFGYIAHSPRIGYSLISSKEGFKRSEFRSAGSINTNHQLVLHRDAEPVQ